MTQSESWARQNDPGIMLAMQAGMLRPEEEILDQTSGNGIGRKIARGALALGLGVVGAGIYETYDSEPASAEQICVVYDPPTGNCIAWEEVPDPTSAPTTRPPSSGGGGGSGGGTPTTQPRPTTTTTPFIEVNNDGDAWSITINKNTGEQLGGWDVNDDSPGLGEQGITQLQSEMTARGLNPATLTDAQKLTAMTVHPDVWSWYFADILSVPTTTTTTTTVAPEPTTAPTTDVQVSSTIAEQPTTTQPQEVVAGVNDESGDDGSSLGGNVLRTGLIAGAGVALGSLLIIGFARRRNKKDQPTPPGPYGGTPRPVAGS